METVVKQPQSVRVFPDADQMSVSAAETIAAEAVRIIADRGRFTIALSGGSTPRRTYALLAASPYRESIPWQQTEVFWADERCVPRDHSESNYKLAFDMLLAHVPLPPRNIHPVPGEKEPGRAAAAYEEDLKKAFGGNSMPVFDFVVLGVGSDGHTASLFPGSPALSESTRLAAPVYFDPPGLSRVTLTLPVLNNAARILFLVMGGAKAGIVHEVLEQGNPKGHPAGLVRPDRGTVLWMLDPEAGSLLRGS